MTPTFPPSPAQGETAGVSERELLDMTMVRLIAAIGTQRVSVDLAKDAVQRLSVLDRDNAALRQQLAELQREKAAAVGLQQGTALVVKQLEQQLADSAHEVERLNAANAAMRGHLHGLVDDVWQAATDSTEVPSVSWADELITKWEAALAPTSHDPVRSAGETSPVPSRGKCELPTSHEIGVAARAGSDAESDPYSYRIGLRAGANWLYDRVSPDCAQGGSPADPERQGADAVALIAGLEMLRDKPMSVSSFVISSIADRAIAALKGAK